MTNLFKTIGVFGLVIGLMGIYPMRSYGDERTCWNNIGRHMCEERCREMGLGYNDDTSCIEGYTEVCDTCCCEPGEGDDDDDEDCECFRDSDCGEGYICDCTCSAKRYSISYGLNGGTGAVNEQYTVEDDDIVLPTPTRDGYEFDGWYNAECLSCN